MYAKCLTCQSQGNQQNETPLLPGFQRHGHSAVRLGNSVLVCGGVSGHHVLERCRPSDVKSDFPLLPFQEKLLHIQCRRSGLEARPDCKWMETIMMCGVQKRTTF